MALSSLESDVNNQLDDNALEKIMFRLGIGRSALGYDGRILGIGMGTVGITRFWTTTTVSKTKTKVLEFLCAIFL